MGSGILHSIVVPVFDEQDVLEAFYARLSAALEGLEDYEIIFVDDGSTDSTPSMLVALSGRDPRVRYVRLSRNFGHQVATTAGIDFARGDTVTTMDGDLQHPPEIVPQLVNAWRDGADIVFAVKRERHGETLGKRFTARAYYRTLDAVSDADIPLDVSDFRLMSRRACDGLMHMREQNRYLRGLVGWMGLQRAFVTYDSEPRHAGTSKYAPRKMLRLAVDGLLSFSARPVRWLSEFGLVVSGIAFIYALYSLYGSVFLDVNVQGWTSLIITVLFFGGVQLIALGLLGEYIGRIYEEVRGRPLYLVREAGGFADGASPDEVGVLPPVR